MLRVGFLSNGNTWFRTGNTGHHSFQGFYTRVFPVHIESVSRTWIIIIIVPPVVYLRAQDFVYNILCIYTCTICYHRNWFDDY